MKIEIKEDDYIVIMTALKNNIRYANENMLNPLATDDNKKYWNDRINKLEATYKNLEKAFK